jgi:hypothetical protein
MSHEHVFPKWLAGVVPNDPTVPCRYRKYMFQETGYVGVLESRDWTTGVDNTPVTFGRVCKQCNEGWLAKIERDTATILRPLIRGDKEITISIADQSVILQWTTKTAMMFDILRPSAFHPFFTASDRLNLATSEEFAFRPTVFLAPYFGTTYGLGAYFVQFNLWRT